MGSIIRFKEQCCFIARFCRSLEQRTFWMMKIDVVEVVANTPSDQAGRVSVWGLGAFRLCTYVSRLELHR